MNLKSLLEKEDLKYVFLGGKGGVGKTISASAIGIELAKHFEQVLIVSTDPAHSLSDCFDQDLSGGDPRRIDGVKGNLFGMELEAQKGMEQYQSLSSMGMPSEMLGGSSAGFPGMGTFGGATAGGDLFGGETPESTSEEEAFNMQDALGLGSDLLSGNSIPPGSDEAFAFGKLLEFIEGSDFDVIVFDTAPTGHTLRLLSLPDYLDSFVGKMLKMRLRLSGLFKGIKSLFGGGREDAEDNALEVLEKLKDTITKARIELSDSGRTEFIPVTIPTLMALYETERLITTLREYNIPVEHLIINQLIPPSKDCPFCAKRYEVQERTMLTLKQYFGNFKLVEVPMVPQEIRGIEQLQLLAEQLF